jgi:hypothetical protein
MTCPRRPADLSPNWPLVTLTPLSAESRASARQPRQAQQRRHQAAEQGGGVFDYSVTL